MKRKMSFRVQRGISVVFRVGKLEILHFVQNDKSVEVFR
jgi:hypothetical protein